MIGYYAFISERDSLAADRFLDSYAASLDRIGERPDIGSARLHTHPSLQGLLAWPVRGFEQFIICYRRSGRGVRILRVLCGSVPPEAVLRTPG